MANVVFPIPVWISILENFFRKVADLLFYSLLRFVDHSLITNQVPLVDGGGNYLGSCDFQFTSKKGMGYWLIDADWSLVLQNIKDIS